jgi:hypothetical protein
MVQVVLVKAILLDSQTEHLGIQAGDIFTHYYNKPILGRLSLSIGAVLSLPLTTRKNLRYCEMARNCFKLKPGKFGAELQEQAIAKRP